MLYTPLTKKAMRIAWNAHMGQYDKAEMPYFLHPWTVAEMMDDEDSVVVALLHDTIEDTYIRPEYLQRHFPQHIVDAIVVLTRKEDETYQEYLSRVKQSPLARKVKLGDLKHNSDLGRMDQVDKTILSLHKRYEKAIQFLTE